VPARSPDNGQTPHLEIDLRYLIAAAATLIAVGATSPALAAAPSATVSGRGEIIQMQPSASAAGPTEIRKKKKEAATVKTVTGAKVGKSGLKIRVKVAKADRVCEMEIEFNDGSAPEIEDVDAGTNKYCTFIIDVPDEDDAAGEATFTVTVKSATGKKMTEVEGSFTVK
jgi:hypothetical protein